MVYETFLKTIQSMVQTRLNKKANVSLRRGLKNNGLMRAELYETRLTVITDCLSERLL